VKPHTSRRRKHPYCLGFPKEFFSSLPKANARCTNAMYKRAHVYTIRKKSIEKIGKKLCSFYLHLSPVYIN
jgi:hypothetical protein|tara:strand:- start:589 stop:801 length:213 start_codon:yes stop_codon:yes gene_type:complete